MKPVVFSYFGLQAFYLVNNTCYKEYSKCYGNYVKHRSGVLVFDLD